MKMSILKLTIQNFLAPYSFCDIVIVALQILSSVILKWLGLDFL